MKKISVISGGTSGLGLEIAELLVKSGRNVLILGRNSEKLSGASERLRKSSISKTVDSLICNVGQGEDVAKLGDYLKKNKFSVNYLFNNAGMGLFTKAYSITS